MERQTCWKPFFYLAIDHKAAQARLNALAAEGWALEKITLGLFARFRRTDRADLSYFLDWTDAAKPEEAEYLQLCAEAGWELVQTVGYLNYYASRPGLRPAPIQTDPALEYQRYRKKVLRRILLSSLLPLLPFLLLFLYAQTFWGLPGNFLWDLLAVSNTLTALLLASPLLLIGAGYYLLCMVRWLLAWRAAAGAGEAPPVASPRAARRRGMLLPLAAAYSTVLLAVLLLDVLLNQAITWGYPVGLLVGAAILLTRYPEDPRINRKCLCVCVVAAVFLLCMALHGTARRAWPGRVPAPPVLAGAEVEHDDARADTLLASRATWWEYLRQPENRALFSPSLRVEVRMWITPGLLEASEGGVPADLTPVEGWEGIWADPQGDGTHTRYLIRRAGTQMILDCYNGPIEGLLDRALSWLGEEGGLAP